MLPQRVYVTKMFCLVLFGFGKCNWKYSFLNVELFQILIVYFFTMALYLKVKFASVLKS